jgi:beta-glucosidase
VRELKGFERLTLQPQESRTLTFRLGPDELGYWNAGSRDWVVDATDLDVYVGGDSTATLSTSLSVTGSTPGLGQDRGV